MLLQSTEKPNNGIHFSAPVATRYILLPRELC